MRTPLQKENAQSSWNETQRANEYFQHEEVRKSTENPSACEWHLAEELQEQSTKPKSTSKKQSTGFTKALYASGIGLATAVTAIVVGAITIIPLASKTASPVFTMHVQEVGLDFFQADLNVETQDALDLTVVLKDADGELVTQMPFDEDDGLYFSGLLYDNAYTVYLIDERGKERFTYSFTTDSFVTIEYLEDGGGAKLILHPSISLGFDYMFFLSDEEGKSFRDNVRRKEIYDDADVSVDAVPIAVEHYIDFAGLYAGEYHLQFVEYFPDEERVYKKKIRLGNLQPLVYTTEINRGTEELVLRYVSGDIWLYNDFYVEAYRGEEYCGDLTATAQEDGSITIALSNIPDGEYTFYLVGIYEETLYNQIWKSNVTVQ